MQLNERDGQMVRDVEAISAARRFFHWELEFPEVFFHYREGSKQQIEKKKPGDAGFDCVIGNPPYEVLSELETGADLSGFQSLIHATPSYRPSVRGKNNLYKLFVCRAVAAMHDNAYLGIITPMAILGDDQAAGLRKYLMDTGSFVGIDAFPQKDDAARRVFAEAKLSTAVLIYTKTLDMDVRQRLFRAAVHPAKEVIPSSPSLFLSTATIPLYDPDNLSIVSCGQGDWDLAVSIMKSGRLGRLGEFAQTFQGELNETNDIPKGKLSHLWTVGPEAIRGAHVCLYMLRDASQGEPLYVNEKKLRANRSKRPDQKIDHVKNRRVGFQRKSPQNNFRRLIAAPIPAGTYLVESVSYVPEHLSKFPLEMVLALLNSELCEWYFRLGSTNAMVGEYQFKILPCPRLRPATPEEKHSIGAILTGLKSDADVDAEQLVQFCTSAPFPDALVDWIKTVVKLAIHYEATRGDISRRDRSELSVGAQRCQSQIDHLLYALAGVSAGDATALRQRLAKML